MGQTSVRETPDLTATQRIIPVLTVFRDGAQVAGVSLDRRTVTIGRAADNDICLDETGVSRRHAQIITVLGESVIEDLDSRNGTFVNGKWIKTRQLAPGDTIVIAGFRLVYQYAADQKGDEVGDLMRRWGRGAAPAADRRCSTCGQPLPGMQPPADPETILL